MAGNEVR